ncbi:uncharacterized protein LOC143360718 isoform X2 [Halictus rubicundus]|uniref:uncharacterized protein LOC143360718 isoform X2 n=1 Tax=Halictus rubicundus TaxID=77578 RepID=UPI0040361372
MMDSSDIKHSLISAVRYGNLERASELVHSFGLSYSPSWSKGYILLCEALKNRRTEIVKLLLINGSKVNNKSKKHSDTPLHLAIVNGDIEIVKMLLDRGADIDAKNKCGCTPLYNAVRNKKMKVIELLLKHRANVNARDNNGKSPLCVAAEGGCLQIVEHLLEYSADVNAITYIKARIYFCEGYTPLHYAVESGSEKIVNLLLKNNANVNTVAIYGVTPLHIAAMDGYVQIAEDLLNHGSYTNSVCTLGFQEGYTPLHFACQQGSEEAVRLFLSRGADVNANAKDNLMPIHVATKAGHETVVKLLLEHGAKVDAQDKDGKTILYLAVKEGYSMIVKDILKYCPDINNQSNRSSLKTAVLGYGGKYKEIVETLLQHDFIVNPADVNNPELLLTAVEKGYLKIVEDMLKYGANVNMLHSSRSKKGFTPLHSAAKNKQKEVAQLFINYGANVNAKDESEKSPILYAIECKEIIEILLQNNADINASDKYGNTALHFTALSEGDGRFFGLYLDKKPNIHVKGEVAALLLSKGANVNAKTKNGLTTLHNAVKNGYTEVVEALLEYNADVNSVVKSDMTTPLHLSAQKGNELLSKMLLNKGANVNDVQKDQRTALHIAAQQGHEKVVEILLKYGAEYDSRAKGDMTPLHFAARNGHKKVVEILLKYGAEYDSRAEGDRTPLHFAAQNGHEKVVEILLKYGAEYDSRAEGDRTPLHFAAQNGHEKVVEILLKYGAEYDSRTEGDITPLHFAAQKDHWKSVESLLEFGAEVDLRNEYEYGSDVNIICKNSRTALEYSMLAVDSFYDNLEQSNYNDSDSDSYYDLGGGIGPHKRVVEILKEYIVKLKSAGLYVSERNLMLTMIDVDRDNEFCYSWSECKAEIKIMRGEKIDNSNTSFHDILTKSISQLAIYARNENIVQALKSDDYKTKFPIYASMIDSRFRRGIEKKELLEQGNKFFHSLSESLPELPPCCTEKILSYLNVKELRILIHACKPLNSPNTYISDVEHVLVVKGRQVE